MSHYTTKAPFVRIHTPTTDSLYDGHNFMGYDGTLWWAAHVYQTYAHPLIRFTNLAMDELNAALQQCRYL